MRSLPPWVMVWPGLSAPPLSARRGNRPQKPRRCRSEWEAFGGVQDAEQDGSEGVAATGNSAQDVVWLQLRVERIDPVLELGERLHVREDDVDLDGDLGLELDEVDMVAMNCRWRCWR